jgi:hypothetical protein
MEFARREGTPSEQTCFVSSGAADITTARIVGRLTGPNLPTKLLWAQKIHKVLQRILWPFLRRDRLSRIPSSIGTRC